FKQSKFFVPQRFSVAAHWSFHREQRQYLEQVVLYDVPNCADFFIKPASSLNTKALGHGDLHIGNVVIVPDRFEERIRKPKIYQILNGLLSKEVIDSPDRRFRKNFIKDPIQCLRRCHISTERFFNDDASILGAT